MLLVTGLGVKTPIAVQRPNVGFPPWQRTCRCIGSGPFGCSSLQGVVQPEALSLWHPPGCGKLKYVSEFAFGFGRATMWG